MTNVKALARGFLDTLTAQRQQTVSPVDPEVAAFIRECARLVKEEGARIAATEMHRWLVEQSGYSKTMAGFRRDIEITLGVSWQTATRQS